MIRYRLFSDNFIFGDGYFCLVLFVWPKCDTFQSCGPIVFLFQTSFLCALIHHASCLTSTASRHLTGNGHDFSSETLSPAGEFSHSSRKIQCLERTRDKVIYWLTTYMDASLAQWLLWWIFTQLWKPYVHSRVHTLSFTAKPFTAKPMTRFHNSKPYVPEEKYLSSHLHLRVHRSSLVF